MICRAPIPAALVLAASLTNPDTTVVAAFFAPGGLPADKTTAEETAARALAAEIT
jgi:hypothetical protein